MMIVELTLNMTFIIHHLALGVLIGGSVWLVFMLPLNISAESKSRMWLVSYLLITLLPFIVFFAPSPPQYQATATAPIIEQADKSLLSVQVVPNALSRDGQAKPSFWHVPQDIVYNFSSLLLTLLALWMLGIVWRFISWARKIVNSHLLAKSLRKVVSIKLSHNQQTVDIWLSTKNSSPMVIGIVQSKIVLPQPLYDTLSNAQLQHIILHEMAHIDRKDLVLGAIQELIAITFWWSPILRPLNKHLSLTRELACDIRAARQSRDNLGYAQTLIDCAKLMFNSQKNVLAMGLFSKKKDLTVRINEIIGLEKSAIFSSIPSLISCALLVFSSVSFASSFAPKIDIPSIKLASNLFLRQSVLDSERLIKAVYNNQFEIIEQMINQGMNIDVAVIGDGTALIMAVRAGNMEMVDKLIAMGANVNQPSMGDGNPLILAAKKGRLNMVKQLLKEGADIDDQVAGDETALINASERGKLAVVKYLVAQGADVNLTIAVNTQQGVEMRSPLSRASTTAVKDFLISQGASL
ncbi:MAG: ankyrin repeat domain-containing protein [Psychrobium sp.]|nr:ankyrin repeat domain-containing protein [Psychrobium sp.]